MKIGTRITHLIPSTFELWQGKVAIVTGGTSGIGKATASLFADHGAVVVIAGIQDEKGRIAAESIGCRYIHCDVTDDDQVKQLVDSTVQMYGQLDIMFSNAGIVSRSSDQAVLDLDLGEFDRVMAVNARGMTSCVKHAGRAMVERGVRGSIVCTGSVAGSRGGCLRTDYIMSKHAVLGLVRSASRQLGAYGIRVNCVSPSAVPTEMSTMAVNDLNKIYEPLTSLKGLELSVEHVADAVLFLSSHDSLFITGQDLAVDGGLTKLPDPNPNTLK